MGADTPIEWCDATFNPWWGCVECSPGCDNCFARAWARRLGRNVWGTDAPRRFFGDKHWDAPFTWDRRAAREGTRPRVFCASMCDIGEERPGVEGQRLTEARRRLWFVIANTPRLHWLLLTKRPRFYRAQVPPEILALPRVWPGVSVESESYMWRVSDLMRLDCAGPRWISAEPLLGPLDLTARVGPAGSGAVEWVIVGCESAPGKKPGRPMSDDWARGIRDQVTGTGAALFVKQLPVDGRVVGRPELDGRQWTQFPRKDMLPDA